MSFLYGVQNPVWSSSTGHIPCSDSGIQCHRQHIIFEQLGRRLEVPHVGVIAFEDGKISSEHIYWDQASALLQLGLLDGNLPVLGATQADRLLNPDAPANELIRVVS